MSTCGSEAEPTLLDFDVIVSAIHDISDGTLAVTTENLKNIQVRDSSSEAARSCPC